MKIFIETQPRPNGCLAVQVLGDGSPVENVLEGSRKDALQHRSDMIDKWCELADEVDANAAPTPRQ